MKWSERDIQAMLQDAIAEALSCAYEVVPANDETAQYSVPTRYSRKDHKWVRGSWGCDTLNVFLDALTESQYWPE